MATATGAGATAQFVRAELAGAALPLISQ